MSEDTNPNDKSYADAASPFQAKRKAPLLERAVPVSGVSRRTRRTRAARDVLADRLFFANASYVKGRVLEAVRGAPTATQLVVFDAEAVTHVDATGLAALEDLVGRLRKEGVELSFPRAKTPLTARLAEKRPLGRPAPPTVRAAVEAVV